jgi:signal transduction histidine kinase/ligand-binding sensor domain-containing protein
VRATITTAAAIAALAMTAAPRSARALDPGARFDQLTYSGWPSVAHASDVHAVFASPAGHLWIGTSGGLARLDGQRMTTIELSRFPGVREATVHRLLESRDGTLWIGWLFGGVSRLRGGTAITLREADGIPPDRIQALAETADGTIWIGTLNGLVRLPPGSTRAVASDEGLPARCIHSLRTGPDGTLWAGTHRGLARWEGRRWHVEDGPWSSSNVDGIWPDPDGTLWLATRDTGVWRRRGPDLRAYGTVDGLGSRRPWAVLRDHHGHLWVSTQKGDLASLDEREDRFHPLTLPPKLCANRIDALAEDREGGLWLGTSLCGLSRLADRPIRVYGRDDGLPSDEPLGLAMHDGEVWLGTRGGGMARWRDDRFAPTAVSCAPGVPCDYCWDFSFGLASRAADPALASLWTVCKTNQVLRWDGSAVSAVKALPGGLPQASFIWEASDGAIWTVLERKVMRAQGDGARRITEQESLQGTRVLFEGRGGTMWIAAEDGVAAWRQGQLRLVRLPATDQPAEVASLVEDPDGTLWMGTKGQGIRRLAHGRISTVGIEAGLPSDWIIQILQDDQGRLWASSGRGIFSVDRRELADVADGKRARLIANLYDANDGVQMRGDSYGHPAGFKDRRGRLWFVTASGLAAIDPSTLVAPAPRVQLEEVRIGGQRFDAGAAAASGAAPAQIDLSFSAGSFAPVDTVFFRYRLEGRDAAFTELGSTHTLRLGPIPTGDYRLVVEARSRDGTWGARPTILPLRLRPPFQRSPQFALLCAAALGLVLLLWHRLRITQTRAGLHAVMSERARIARDIHDTLAQAFAATSVQLECLEDALEGGERSHVRRHLDTARRVVEESLDEARRAVWVLRPQAIEAGLVVALERLVGQVSGGTPIDLEVSGPARTLPPAVASNLLRIAHEAVANARRHARARHIGLRLTFFPRSVALSVSDDGQGLGGASAGTSQGMVGMRERACDMGGVLSIDSGPDRGTTVRVEVAA